MVTRMAGSKTRHRPYLLLVLSLLLTLASTVALLACVRVLSTDTPSPTQAAVPTPVVASPASIGAAARVPETPGPATPGASPVQEAPPALTDTPAPPASPVAALPVPETAPNFPFDPSALLDPHVSLSAYEEVLVGIYESILPSVVQVQVRTNVRAGGLFGGELRPVPSEGSGFVWSSEGHIVTNHHVIEDADRVMVVFHDDMELPAEVLGSDPDSDLAVLKVEPPDGGLKPVQQGDSDQLRVGQLAFAVGSPFGQEFSMTGGIVSALGRVIPAGASQFSNPNVIQTDTPINPGNSGGPLLDRYANVIGINAQILSRSGSSSGVGFAVPINTAKRIIPVLIEEGDYTYAYLGISGTTVRNTLAEVNGLPSGTRGVLLVGIVPDGPADKAGLAEAEDTRDVDGVTYPVDGDVITAIDDVPVRGIDDLISHMLEYHRPGDEVTLDVLSDGRVRKVVVELSARPEIGPLGAVPESSLPRPG